MDTTGNEEGIHASLQGHSECRQFGTLQTFERTPLWGLRKLLDKAEHSFHGPAARHVISFKDTSRLCGFLDVIGSSMVNRRVSGPADLFA